MNKTKPPLIYQSVNPYTQTKIQTTPTQSLEEVNSIIETTHSQFQKWSKKSIQERLSLISQVFQTLQNEIEHHASIISTEMGKPITAATTEIQKCISMVEYYQTHAEYFLKPETNTDASERIIYQPTGTILGILPWNYPYWQVCRFAIPTLISGNTVVIKHAPNVSLCIKNIEDLFTRHQLPILKAIFSDPPDTEAIIQNPKITGISFTGSSTTGSLIASLAGKHVKPCVMELGGMDPFIVFKDALMPNTARMGMNARCTNSGQVCINAKRFIVHESLVDQFINDYLKECEYLIVGNPLLPTTTFGPMARPDIYNKVMTQLTKSIQMGATLHQSKLKIPKSSQFIAPALLTNVTPKMPILSEEVFGPIAAVISFRTHQEAIQIANDIPYGLGASIWTQSKETAEELIPQIDAGSVYVNRTVTSLINLPFGGIKKSGFGRELGRWGLHNFCSIKTVVTKF